MRRSKRPRTSQALSQRATWPWAPLRHWTTLKAPSKQPTHSSAAVARPPSNPRASGTAAETRARLTRAASPTTKPTMKAIPTGLVTFRRLFMYVPALPLGRQRRGRLAHR
jgi:hypothetical protein